MREWLFVFARVLRDFAWLDAGRARAYARILIAMTLLAAVAWIALGRGGLDRDGKPIGTDFVGFYSASKLALHGRPDLAYDVKAHWAAQKALFGQALGYTAFFYPPPALLISLPLALAPYFLSLAAWVAATGYGFFRVLRGYWAELDLATFIAFPAIFINAAHGQNGFLSASLIGGGLLVMNERPALAGALFGAMAYKPHLALALPVALIVSRRWTTLAVAGGTAIAFCGLSFIAFGPAAWQGFFADAPFARAALEHNLVGDEKMQSVFAAVRLLHGSLALAWGAQIAAAGAACATLWRLQRQSPRSPAEAPATVCAGLLMSPFLLDYDLTLVAIPLVWLLDRGLRTGFLPYEKAAMAFAFLLPLVSRSAAGAAGVPLAPFAMAAVFALILRRARSQDARSDIGVSPGRGTIGLSLLAGR